MTVQIHTGLGGELKLRQPLTAQELYAMRLGSYGPWQGVEVIGYLGIADRLGYRTGTGAIAEQSARRLGTAPASWYPQPVFTVLAGGHRIRLFAWPAVREAAIQAGALALDGVTPQRRVRRRGKDRRPRARKTRA